MYHLVILGYPQFWVKSAPFSRLTRSWRWFTVQAMGQSVGRVFSDLWNVYGSIPINTIFSGMNIHKSQLFWCELQAYKVLTHCHILREDDRWWKMWWDPKKALQLFSIFSIFSIQIQQVVRLSSKMAEGDAWDVNANEQRGKVMCPHFKSSNCTCGGFLSHRGTPKSSIYRWISPYKPSILGIPIYRNPRLFFTSCQLSPCHLWSCWQGNKLSEKPQAWVRHILSEYQTMIIRLSNYQNQCSSFSI